MGDFHEHTLAEVGAKLGISRERVRQIENKALKKLYRSLRRTDYQEDVRDRYIPPIPEPRQNHPRGPVSSNGVDKHPKRQPEEVIRDSLSNRARQHLASESCPDDPQARSILTMISRSDKASFALVRRRISAIFGIPEDQVVSTVMTLIDQARRDKNS